jgi:hypothetical protein
MGMRFYNEIMMFVRHSNHGKSAVLQLDKAIVLI